MPDDQPNSGNRSHSRGSAPTPKVTAGSLMDLFLGLTVISISGCVATRFALTPFIEQFTEIDDHFRERMKNTYGVDVLSLEKEQFVQMAIADRFFAAQIQEQNQKRAELSKRIEEGSGLLKVGTYLFAFRSPQSAVRRSLKIGTSNPVFPGRSRRYYICAIGIFRWYRSVERKTISARSKYMSSEKSD